MLKIPSYFSADAKSETFDIYQELSNLNKELEQMDGDLGLGLTIREEMKSLNERLSEIMSQEGLNRQISSLNGLVNEDGNVTIRPLGLSLVGLTIAGPNARKLLAKVTDEHVSNEAFRFMDFREMDVAGRAVMVGRNSRAQVLKFFSRRSDIRARMPNRRMPNSCPAAISASNIGR